MAAAGSVTATVTWSKCFSIAPILAGSGPVHELQLQPVGIGEEQGVIARAIVGIVGRRIEDAGAARHEQTVQPVDILATFGVPGEVMEAGAVAVMGAIRSCGLEPDRA